MTSNNTEDITQMDDLELKKHLLYLKYISKNTSKDSLIAPFNFKGSNKEYISYLKTEKIRVKKEIKRREKLSKIKVN